MMVPLLAQSVLLYNWGCCWQYAGDEPGECGLLRRRRSLERSTRPTRHRLRYRVNGLWSARARGRRNSNVVNYDTRPGGSFGACRGKHPGTIPAKSVFNVPIAEESTATHRYESGTAVRERTDFSLGMEDGIYESDSPKDKELKLQYEQVLPAARDDRLVHDPVQQRGSICGKNIRKAKPRSALGLFQHHAAAADGKKPSCTQGSLPGP